MASGFTSKVSIARPNTTSLRTTIPEGIAKAIGLNSGDILLWRIVPREEKLVIIVTKGED